MMNYSYEGSDVLDLEANDGRGNGIVVVLPGRRYGF